MEILVYFFNDNNLISKELGEKLYEEGFKKIISIDFSSILIDYLNDKFSQYEGMECNKYL